MEEAPLLKISSAKIGSNASLLSKSGFGQGQNSLIAWKTFFVRGLFLLLLILSSVSVGWFFAGGKFFVEFPQSTPILVAREEDVPIENDSLSDVQRYSKVEKEIRNEDDLIKFAIDYDQTPAQCVRQKDRLYFLKTHKTASSVVENILYRYGLRTDKTFAFPKNGALVYNYRKPFTKGMMQPDIPPKMRTGF
ncbi:unnamed protein product [Oikopleura dioica]|uniref:Uncharacterized protein n=1 Tax=Oikopleura dioica TaxID=34765 RepID=E4XBM6_OIKDI|nr:unnamed protein product [Oikopleura dioica]